MCTSVNANEKCSKLNNVITLTTAVHCSFEYLCQYTLASARSMQLQYFMDINWIAARFISSSEANYVKQEPVNLPCVPPFQSAC